MCRVYTVHGINFHNFKQLHSESSSVRVQQNSKTILLKVSAGSQKRALFFSFLIIRWVDQVDPPYKSCTKWSYLTNESLWALANCHLKVLLKSFLYLSYIWMLETIVISKILVDCSFDIRRLFSSDYLLMEIVPPSSDNLVLFFRTSKTTFSAYDF